MSRMDKNKRPIMDQIEQFLGQPLPEFIDQLASIESAVEGVLKQVLPGFQGGEENREVCSKKNKPLSTSKGPPSAETFETHTHVYARIRLHRREDPKSLQVLVRSDHVKIIGLLYEPEMIISFPSIVAPKTAKAKVRDGVLQIGARKRKAKDSYYETFIEL